MLGVDNELVVLNLHVHLLWLELAYVEPGEDTPMEPMPSEDGSGASGRGGGGGVTVVGR